jgi:hypothetical protein
MAYWNLNEAAMTVIVRVELSIADDTEGSTSGLSFDMLLWICTQLMKSDKLSVVSGTEKQTITGLKHDRVLERDDE